MKKLNRAEVVKPILLYAGPLLFSKQEMDELVLMFSSSMI